MKNKDKKVSGMLAALVMSFIATSAFAATIDYGGVTWTYSVNGTGTAYISDVSATTDAANIPWTFTVDDTTYTVTEIGGLSGKITGTLNLPESVVNIHDAAFCNSLITNVVIPRSMATIGADAFSNTLVKAALIPGPATVAPGGSQPLTTITVGCQFAGCPNLSTIVLGPNTTTDRTNWGSLTMARYRSGITGFVPAERNINGFVVKANASNKVYEYGPGRELDLDIDVENKLMTATVTTENMFTVILAKAPLFKSEFGMDTRINITNDFELSEAAISQAMLSGAFFNHLRFSANNQAQLDAILAKIRPDIPLVIDISDATEPITIPENRFVAIRANAGWTFKKRRNGFIIMYR